MTQARLRGRQQLILLAVLFFAPLLAAFVLYFLTPQWQPEGHTNYGELVHPAQPLPEAALRDAEGNLASQDVLRGRWSFVYLGTQDCDSACAAKLYQIRQVRTLLNEKRQRVQRVYLAPDAESLARVHAALAAEHADLVWLADVDGTLKDVFATAQADPQALYLVDPLGNWMMVYAGGAESTGLLKDIKRLLRISQIG